VCVLINGDLPARIRTKTHSYRKKAVRSLVSVSTCIQQFNRIIRAPRAAPLHTNDKQAGSQRASCFVFKCQSIGRMILNCLEKRPAWWRGRANSPIHSSFYKLTVVCNVQSVHVRHFYIWTICGAKSVCRHRFWTNTFAQFYYYYYYYKGIHSEL